MQRTRIAFELALFAVFVAFAIWLAANDAAHQALLWHGPWRYAGALIAGALFTSMFTSPVAMVLIVAYAQVLHPAALAAIGAIGAMLGDMVLLRFVDDELSASIIRWGEKQHWHGWWIFDWHSRYAHAWIILLGCLVVASPLPDELGILMLGLSHMSLRRFAPISLLMNGVGIYTIALVGAIR